MGERYRMKQSGTIEAVRWHGGKLSSTPQWIVNAISAKPASPNSVFRYGDKIEVYTPSGKAYAFDGDYIIRNALGDLLVYAPEIFNDLYEPIAEANRGGWVSVRDEKPAGGDVLITFYSVPCGKKVVCEAEWDGEMFWVAGDREDFTQDAVTHWQPLPAPPKEETK